MILKSYLFCLKQNNYVQYPNDHTASFLKPLCGNLKEKHQVVVYRDGGLMYYCYLCNTGKTEIIGLCFATGSLCTKLKPLYDRFLTCLDCFAKRGVIFCFADDGGIQSVGNFTQNIGEVEELFRWLKNHNESNRMSWEDLPPEDHTIAKGSCVYFNFEEDDYQSIVEATRHYTYVFITMHNPIPTSYSATVKRLFSENEILVAEKSKLNEQIKQINKQKKQYKLVAILASLMIVVAAVFVVVISDKNQKIKSQLSTIQNNEETISVQDRTISTQKNTISSQKNTIDEQNEKIIRLNNTVEELESKCTSLESDFSSVTSVYPFKITRISIGNAYQNDKIETDYGNSLYSSRTMYLKPKIYYYGYVSGTQQLKVKWYTPSGEIKRGNRSPTGYSQSESVYIYNGSNDLTMRGWGGNDKGHWPSGIYRIEIWYDDMCLKSKTFTIY